jgi:ubiquinone/menaquinone biosynthesis C-methylase UbiE
MNTALGVTLTSAATAFDRVAGSYDAQFTDTAIGRAQRKPVWAALLAAFPPGCRILELNCGTGEDARFLSEHGRYVVACDASAEMIAVAKRRKPDATLQYMHLANEELSSLQPQASFDGAFSNFSGLNCLADLSPVTRELANLVKPGGRVLVCIWSRVCPAEILWYLLRAQPRKALRRFRIHSVARLGGLDISVTYHTLREIRRSFSPWFDLKSRRAIGLFVPPSYAESWMRRHQGALALLESMDHALADRLLFRDLGDHMLLEFVRCKP